MLAVAAESRPCADADRSTRLSLPARRQTLYSLAHSNLIIKIFKMNDINQLKCTRSNNIHGKKVFFPAVQMAEVWRRRARESSLYRSNFSKCLSEEKTERGRHRRPTRIPVSPRHRAKSVSMCFLLINIYTPNFSTNIFKEHYLY